MATQSLISLAEKPRFWRLFANQTEKIFETLHDDMGRFEPSVSAQASRSQIIVTKKVRQVGLTLSDYDHTVSLPTRPEDSRP
jgi:hypothetical protein